MADTEGSLRRPVTSIALWRGDRRPARVVQESPVEQDLQQASQQGASGSVAFDAEYSLWLEEHNKYINELRTAVNLHASDLKLRRIVDNVIAHYNEIYRAKENAAKEDVFHVLSGMWMTPADRCFMWIGGFRPSELLKIVASQIEPMSELQVCGICNLHQSSQQAEDSLSEGMEVLQLSLLELLAYGSLATEGSSGDLANYTSQMAMGMEKLADLKSFICQADGLRQHALQQMHSILTTRQSARALIVISELFSRLRALSSLWLARLPEQ